MCLLAIGLYPVQPPSMKDLDHIRNPLDEFRDECTVFYDQLKAFHDKIILVPQKDRKNFELELDQLNYTQMALADKAVNIPYFADKPSANQVVAYLQLALIDLDRLMYPPADLKPDSVDVVGEILDGAIAGTVAGISKTVLGQVDESVRGAIRSAKPIERAPRSVSEAADRINKLASQGFSWPGLFPFAVGLFESAVGVVVAPFNPALGGVLLFDGLKRVISGISENMEGNAGGSGGSSKSSPQAPKMTDYK